METTNTMKASKLALPVAFILVGGLLLVEVLPRAFLGGTILTLSGLTIISSFTFDHKRFTKAKAPLSRSQRAFFVICGTIISLIGAWMIWERI